MVTYNMTEAETFLAELIWESEPIGSGDLVKLAAQRLGWKKSTTYTVIKRLTAKGIVENQGAVVRALVSKEAVDRRERDALVAKQCGGSAPDFLAAFLRGRPLTGEELDRVRRILDELEQDG